MAIGWLWAAERTTVIAETEPRMNHSLTQMSDWERLLFHSTSFALFASFAVIVCLSFSFASFAQDDTKPDVPAASGPSSADELALEQSRVADKYAKLEQLMLKMAEL